MDLNYLLRAVDRRTDRVARRLARRTSRGDLEFDLLEAVLDAMVAGHRVALEMPVELSDPTSGPKRQRDSLRQFYASIARSATDKTMSEVRDRLVKDARDIAVGAGKNVSVRAAMKKAGVSRDDAALYATIIKTHTAMAFNTAVWSNYAKEPGTWGFAYETAMDERVRPEHEELQGARYPTGHPFWDTNTPPNGWNCRCRLRRILRGSKEARMKQVKEPPTNPPEFRYNPGKLLLSAE